MFTECWDIDRCHPGGNHKNGVHDSLYVIRWFEKGEKLGNVFVLAVLGTVAIWTKKIFPLLTCPQGTSSSNEFYADNSSQRQVQQYK